MLLSSVAAAKADTPRVQSRSSLPIVRDVSLQVQGMPAIPAARITAHLAEYKNHLDLEYGTSGADPPVLFYSDYSLNYDMDMI